MESIISNFSDIAKPFKRGIGEKESAILDLLKDHNAYYEKDIGIIVPSVKSRRIVIVSHIDLIPKFNKGFENSKTIEIKDGTIKGALDNTITNAILIDVIKETRANESSLHVEFVFTEEEETTFGGIKTYLEKNKNFISDLFFINLDVTNDNWGNSISIEYDKPSFSICKQISTIVENHGITKDRDSDDLCMIMKYKGYGFSYCLPTKDLIHSYKNYARLKDLLPYKKGLIKLIKKLKTGDHKEDLITGSLQNAMKFESFKKLKKHEKKELKKLRKRRESISISSRRKFNRFDHEKLTVSVESLPFDERGQLLSSSEFEDIENMPFHFEETYTNGAAQERFQDEFEIYYQDLDEVDDDEREEVESELYERIEERDELILEMIEKSLEGELEMEETLIPIMAFFERTKSDSALETESLFSQEDMYLYIYSTMVGKVKDKKLADMLATSAYALKILIEEKLIDCDNGIFAIPFTERPYFEYF